MNGRAKRGPLLWGLLFLVSGLVCVYQFGYLPWRDGTDHAPEVTLNIELLIFSPLMVMMGALLLIPLKELPAVEPVPGQKSSMPLRGRLFLGGLIVTSAGAVAYYFWRQAFLRAQGYDV